MSSGLQLDVRHHVYWRRHLVNAYEVKAGMVFFAGQKLCDPCLSALEWFVPYKCCDLPYFTFATFQIIAAAVHTAQYHRISCYLSASLVCGQCDCLCHGMKRRRDHLRPHHSAATSRRLNLLPKQWNLQWSTLTRSTRAS